MQRNWSNTTLVAYSLLPKITNELDYAVKRRIKMSYQSVHLRVGISTEKLIGEITSLIDEKRQMLCLKDIVLEALESVEPSIRAVLTKRLVEKKTFEDIAMELKLSMRTVFRRFCLAEKEYAKALRMNGYGEKWLEREFSSNRYIRAIYNRIQEGVNCHSKNM